MKAKGVEWDAGNWPKCGKHGVTQDEVEYVLAHTTFVIPDPFEGEPRLRTAGKTLGGRHVFIVFMHKHREDGLYLRPISARYMHDKEIEKYEQFRKTLAKPQK